MKYPDYTLTFAIREDFVSPAGKRFESDKIEVTIVGTEGSLVVGEYSYESDSRFGSSSISEERIFFDTETPLVAIITVHDNPKPQSVFRALDEALPVAVSAPSVPAQSQHELYMEDGFGQNVNGYTISFKNNQSTYEIGGGDVSGSLDPEREAEERAKYSNKRMNGELVHEIAEDAMEDGMYIWSADLAFGDYVLGFSDRFNFQ